MGPVPVNAAGHGTGGGGIGQSRYGGERQAQDEVYRKQRRKEVAAGRHRNDGSKSLPPLRGKARMGVMVAAGKLAAGHESPSPGGRGDLSTKGHEDSLMELPRHTPNVWYITFSPILNFLFPFEAQP